MITNDQKWHAQELGATQTPFYASLMSTLGASLAEAGRFPEAMLTFRTAQDVYQVSLSKSASYARLCLNVALAKQAQLEFGIQGEGLTGTSVAASFQEAKEAFEAAGACKSPEYFELQVHLNQMNARRLALRALSLRTDA